MRDIRAHIAKTWKPKKKVWVWEYADEHQYLDRTASAVHGRYQTSRFPFLREPMECMSPQHPCKKIVIMKGAQLGFSDAVKNLILYAIAEDPGPIMVVLPDLTLAKRWAQTRLRPMILNNPTLKEIFKGQTTKAVDGLISMDFPGGNIQVVGSNSPATLSQFSGRYIVVDELDRCNKNVGGEGDTVSIIENRAMSFDNRKVIYLGTPVDEDGFTNREFLLSDQRYHYVPCPECDHFQIMEWETVIQWIDDDPKTASFVCGVCGAVSTDDKKTEMLMRGEWRAHNPKSDIPGFAISSLYCPIGFYSWEEAVADWLKSKDSELMQRAFINTKLGKPRQVADAAPPWKDLFLRREDYQIGVVPDEVCILTAGCDVQKDRLEIEVIGWKHGLENWSIDYQVLYGDTSRPEVWDDLAAYIQKPFSIKSGGTMALAKVAVDTGYSTQDVYRFLRKFNPYQVIGVKGQHTCLTPIGTPSYVDIDYGGEKVKEGAIVWGVGSSIIKSEIYGWLGLSINDDGKTYPPGYCHFPQYTNEYFEQLTAEKRTSITNSHGNDVGVWKKTRARNEALDVRVYARAALASLGADQWVKHQWDAARGVLDIPLNSNQDSRDNAASSPPQRAVRKETRGKTSSWLRGR